MFFRLTRSGGRSVHAVVLILLWAKIHGALQKQTAVAEEIRETLHLHQDEVSISSYELEDDAMDEEQLTKELSHEAAWSERGKHSVPINAKTRKESMEAAPIDTPQRPSLSMRKFHEEFSGAIPKRTKRKIFGYDNRLYIPRNYTQVFPFNATVKISTGCTGTLVSPRHVLTSAHCIHSGKAYEPGFENLSVGFLQRNASMSWVTVSQTYLPRNWTSGHDTDASKSDYAILKLSKMRSRGFMPITLSEGKKYGSGHKIHFSAFEDDKPSKTMWYRHCTILNASKNMLFHCCDARPGSSGAGVYVYFYDNKTRSRVRKVVGIFSGNRFVYNRPDWSRCRYGYSRNPNAMNYNAAIRINSINFRQMCKWMERDGGDDCKDILLEERRKKRRRRRRRNRHRRRNGCRTVKQPTEPMSQPTSRHTNKLGNNQLTNEPTN